MASEVALAASEEAGAAGVIEDGVFVDSVAGDMVEGSTTRACTTHTLVMDTDSMANRQENHKHQYQLLNNSVHNLLQSQCLFKIIASQSVTQQSIFFFIFQLSNENFDLDRSHTL